MAIDRKIIHEIKNQLSISMGLIELVQKTLLKDKGQSENELERILDRLERSITAQKKIQTIIEHDFAKEKV